jgi:hypothetical protein
LSERLLSIPSMRDEISVAAASRRDIAVSRRCALLLTTVVEFLLAGTGVGRWLRRGARCHARSWGAMTEARLEPPAPTAVRQLVDAVIAFSEDPGPDNLERYLAASRALEDSRGRPPHSRIAKETAQ